MSGTMTVPPPIPSRPDRRPPTPPHVAIVPNRMSGPGGAASGTAASVSGTAIGFGCVGVGQEPSRGPQIVGQPLSGPIGVTCLHSLQDLGVLGHELLGCRPHRR